MIEQVIQEVDIAQLKAHPKCANIYRKLNNVDLAAEIAKNGILHPPIVNKKFQIIGGERTVEAAILNGFKRIKVCVVDVSDSDAPAYRVFSNTIRDKTESEIFQELLILRKFYGTRQGKRPVLHEKEAGLEQDDLRTKMSKITGLSATKIQRIEKLAEKNLLAYADSNIIPITALYNSAEEKNNDVSSYKPAVEIPLVQTCCNACRQPTGRIVFTRANTLQYREHTDEDQILF